MDQASYETNTRDELLQLLNVNMTGDGAEMKSANCPLQRSGMYTLVHLHGQRRIQQVLAYLQVTAHLLRPLPTSFSSSCRHGAVLIRLRSWSEESPAGSLPDLTESLLCQSEGDPVESFPPVGWGEMLFFRSAWRTPVGGYPGLSLPRQGFLQLPQKTGWP